MKKILKCKSKLLKSYEIVLQNGIFTQIIDDLDPLQKYLIITDSNIKKIYGNKLNQILLSKGISSDIIHFEAGEEQKSLLTFSQLHEKIELNLDRNSCIIALGGGVTGDMAGFVASTYMRGIDFIQIPTSLLSMVDSSIGGKLGVNTSIGKNCVGLFNNPKKVYIDPTLITTLPREYFIDGMGEVIKHGIISDKKYFNFLVTKSKEINSLELNTIFDMIFDSIAFKVKIVEEDEKEAGLRKILNFGHTIGHSLEETIGYNNISHGYAVSIGMNAALYLSLKREMISQNLFIQIQSVLKNFNLPLYISDLKLKAEKEEIFKNLSNDKKNEQNTIVFVLINGIGSPIIVKDLTTNEIKEAINYVIKNRNMH